MKRALLTGATGFIGSHLAKRLISEGWTVHALVRPSSQAEDLVRLPEERLQLHVTDGSVQDLTRAARESRADVCFHLASLFLANHTPEQIPDLVRDNILFSTQLTEALVAAGVPKLVNVGTAWQHYDSSSYNPVALYAATKQAFEDILRFYTETTKLRAITLKLFDSYGPGDRRKKIFALLQQAAESGAPLEMTGGEQFIDLVYIDDIVSAFTRAATLFQETTIKHECFAVTSGSALKVKDLVDIFSRVTGIAPKVILGRRPYRPREMMTPWNAGPVLPGWRPLVSLEEGIRKTYGNS